MASNNDRFWFSHDFHSRSDKNILKLRMSLKMEGVGIYWCIVEMLYEEQGYIMLSECERIAFELQVDVKLVTRVVNDFDLFKKDRRKFWSETALKRMELRKLKSVKASESANERWSKEKKKKRNANA